MALSNVEPYRNDYDGDGAVSEFTFTLPIFTKADLLVLLDGGTQTLDTHYKVLEPGGLPFTSLAASSLPSTGKIKFIDADGNADPPASGTAIAILRNQPAVQSSTYTTEPFPPKRIEKDYDKAIMLLQQILERLERTPSLAPKSEASGIVIDELVTGRFARATASGDIDWAKVVSAGEVSLPLGTDDGGTGKAVTGSTKGDLLTGRTGGGFDRKAVGTTGHVVKADSTAGDGLAYKAIINTLNGPAVQSLSGADLTLTLLELMGGIYNGSLKASVATNALTVELKTKAGADPSSTDPVHIAFRSATAGDGDFSIVTVTAALSLTVSSGSTLDTQNGVPSRLYVYLLNNAGTAELAIYNPIGAAGNIRRLHESQLQTTVAEGGAGGADLAHTLYSATQRSNVAVAFLGIVESTQGTAGTWATAPSLVQTAYPGMPKTGDIVQRVESITVADHSATTNMVLDDTKPQNTEGDELMTQAITPTSAVNRLRILHLGHYGGSANIEIVAALFKDSDADALSVAAVSVFTAILNPLMLAYEEQAGSVSARTYKIRFGETSTSTAFVNRRSAGAVFADTVQTKLTIEEVWV